MQEELCCSNITRFTLFLSMFVACTPSIDVVLKKASQGSNNKKKVCGRIGYTITLNVKGRKSGRNIPRPVWFVHEGNTIYVAAYLSLMSFTY
jgi:hypothetical protein